MDPQRQSDYIQQKTLMTAVLLDPKRSPEEKRADVLVHAIPLISDLIDDMISTGSAVERLKGQCTDLEDDVEMMKHTTDGHCEDIPSLESFAVDLKKEVAELKKDFVDTAELARSTAVQDVLRFHKLKSLESQLADLKKEVVELKEQNS